MNGKVDLSFARIVAYKRLVTGALSLASGVGLLVLLSIHGRTPPAAFLGLGLLFGGGAWTLRDGLRLRREVLAAGKTGAPAMSEETRR